MSFGIVSAKEVMVPMRDGVRLAADIYRPATDSEPVATRFPTILARTSYDKSAQRYIDSIPGYLTPRGTSPVAMVQTAAALYRPPHLTAIRPDVEPINIYAHMSREGGHHAADVRCVVPARAGFARGAA